MLIQFNSHKLRSPSMYKDIKIQSISCLTERIVQLFNCKWLNLIILSIFDTHLLSQSSSREQEKSIYAYKALTIKLSFYDHSKKFRNFFFVCVACENANLKITDRMDFVTLYSNFYFVGNKFFFGFHR
jgi:hypothetical protein